VTAPSILTHPDARILPILPEAGTCFLYYAGTGPFFFPGTLFQVLPPDNDLVRVFRAMITPWLFLWWLVFIKRLNQTSAGFCVPTLTLYGPFSATSTFSTQRPRTITQVAPCPPSGPSAPTRELTPGPLVFNLVILWSLLRFNSVLRF